MPLRATIRLLLLTGLLLLVTMIPTMAQANTTLVTYPRPCGNGDCARQSALYGVRVNGGSGWQNSFVYYSQGRDFKADEGLNAPIFDSSMSNSWTNFSFGGGPVTVQVTKPGGASSVVVRPLSDDVSVTLRGNVATFTLSQPGQYSVEFDGEYDHAMLIFADPLETYTPNPNNLPSNVHYFGPGLHDIGFFYGWWGRDGRRIQEGDIIYIAGGAYLRGTIRAEEQNGRNLQNVQVIGRGIISGERIAKRGSKDYDAFVAGKDSTIEGVTITDPPHFGVGGLQSGVDWVKVMGWYGSTDAFAIRREATIQNSFSKVNDDHIKAEPDQTVNNNVFWLQLNGSAVSLGYTYDDERSGFTMIDSDVIHADGTERNAVIQANMGGGALITDYLFEDIRVEGNATALFGIAVRPNEFVVSEEYGNIRNITFRNVSLQGRVLESNWLYGRNPQNRVSNITFENLSIDGRPVTNGDEGQLSYGPYVENVRFVQNGNTVGVENGLLPKPGRSAVYLPAADTWINQEEPNQNYGVVGSSPRPWEYEHAEIVHTTARRDRSMFVRFDVGSVPQHTQAHLVLMTKELVDGPTRHRVELIAQDGWNEGGITWNNARGYDAVASAGLHSVDYGLNFIDVTDAIASQRDGRFTFRIRGTERWNISRYYTREALTPVLFFSNSVTDVNDDGRVTPTDAIYVRNRLGATANTDETSMADVNGDGVVNASDVQIVIEALGTTAN